MRKRILEGLYQGSPVPGVYRIMRNKKNIYTGHSGNMNDRFFFYENNNKFVNKYRYRVLEKGIMYSHIEQYEIQSKYLANAFELIVHNFFSPIMKNEEENVFRKTDLEKEYYDYKGKKRELEIFELLGYESMPLLDDLLKLVRS